LVYRVPADYNYGARSTLLGAFGGLQVDH
jgi:hypothetical protein